MKRLFGTGLLVLLLGQMWMVVGQQASAKSASATADVFPPAAALKVGASAPDFTLEDEQGRKGTLSPASAKTPTLVFFFRGWW